MTADKYDPEREVTAQYRETVATWIQDGGEVLVILRYLRAAGAKDYAFARSVDEFDEMLEILPTGTDIIAFRDKQLPLRGVVDNDFIEAAKSLINDGDEYMYVKHQTLKPGDIRAFGSMGDTHSGMVEDLSEHAGDEVAIGLCPPFWESDNDVMISASKGGIDGPR